MWSNPDLFFSFWSQETNKLNNFPDIQDSKKCENPIFPGIPGSIGQPSLVGYPGPIQSTEDNNFIEKTPEMKELERARIRI